nr:MFS transporter [Bacillus taeanensis]
MSDRMLSRISLIKGSAIWLAIGWGLISLSTHSVTVFIIGVVFFSMMGTLNAQTFGVVRDVINREQESREATITSTIRSTYSFGWALGPVMGSVIAGLAGYRIAFLAPVILFLAILFPLRKLQVQTKQATANEREKTKSLKSWGTANVSLLFFGLICALVLSGEAVRLAYLPIYVVDELKINMMTFSLMMSAAPLTEIFVMPAVGAFADRFGIHKILLGGFLIGGLGFLLFSTSDHPWLLFLGQMMNACFIAIIFGLGVTYAQQLSPHNIGLASSIFFSAQSFSFIAGSFIGSYGVHLMGLPLLFLIPSILSIVSCVLFFINHRMAKEKFLQRTVLGAKALD